MKKFTKTFLSGILAAAMIITSVPETALIAQAATDDEILIESGEEIVEEPTADEIEQLGSVMKEDYEEPEEADVVNPDMEDSVSRVLGINGQLSPTAGTYFKGINVEYG